MSTPDTVPDRLLTSSEAAALLPGAVSARTIRRYAERGILPVALRLPGGAQRFRRADVLAALRPAVAAR